MSTIYKFDGEIHIKQIEHMYEKIKSIFKEDRHIRKKYQFMKDGMGKEQTELVLQLSHSIVHKDGEEESDTSVLIFDVKEDGYISSIGRWGKQNPYLMNQFIHLIEYFTKVKIWDEYDLFDIEEWIGVYDEHYENSLDMVS